VSIELLQRATVALGDLVDSVVFVGGATIVLWVTDPTAPPARPTKDVDVIIEVTTRPDLHRFEQRLRDAGFREAMDSNVICRWRHADDADLILDAMPARGELLGFENRWQREALPHARTVELPGGARIRAVSPDYLLATKLAAYADRGRGDLIGSRDMEDVVALLDGREELVAEVAAAPGELRRFLAERFRALLSDENFADTVFAFLRGDSVSQARAGQIVIPRMEAIARAH
jgi:hypothetical protein